MKNLKPYSVMVSLLVVIFTFSPVYSTEGEKALANLMKLITEASGLDRFPDAIVIFDSSTVEYQKKRRIHR